MSSPSSGKALLRLLLTLAIPAGFLYLGDFILAPGIDHKTHRGLLFNIKPSMFTLEKFSLFSLGLAPLFSAFITVEILAVLVPPWRKLRKDPLAGRFKLKIATYLLSGGFVAVQSYGIFKWLNDIPPRLLLPEASWLSLMLFWMMGTLTLITLLELVERYGVGNGFSVMILVSMLLSDQAYGYYTSLKAIFEPTKSNIRALGFDMLLIAIIGVVIWFLFREKRTTAHTGKPILPAGIVPYTWTPIFLSIPVITASFVPSLTKYLSSYHPHSTVYQTVNGILIVLLGVLFSYLFNMPKHALLVLKPSYSTESTEQQQEMENSYQTQLKSATLRNLLLLLALFGMTILSQKWGFISKYAPLYKLSTVALLFAIGFDLHHEYKAHSMHSKLVPLITLHRVYAVEPCVKRLKEADIFVMVKGFRHRTLLQFFGPYVGMTLLVPASKQEQARDLLLPTFSAQQ